MSSSKKVLKAQEITLVDADAAASALFVPAEYPHSPEGPAGPSRLSSQERLRRNHEHQLEKAKKTSWEQGFAAGKKKGAALQREEFHTMIQVVTDLTRTLSRLKEDVLAGAAEEVLSLAFAIAEKVLHQEVSTNPDVIRGVLKEAIRNIVDREGMKIRLHPDDFQTMVRMKKDFLQEMDGIRNMVFEEDPGIKRGGVVIESLFGEVDARIDKQFETIKTKLKESH